MVSSNASKLAAGSSVAAAIFAAMAFVKTQKASAAPESGIPVELMDLVIAMAATLDNIDVDTDELSKILDAIQNLNLSGSLVVPNADYMRVSNVTLNVVATAAQLPDIVIPDDMLVVVKSWPTNPVGGQIWLASTRAECLNINTCYSLVPNEFRALRLKNAKELYVSATAVPAIVSVSAEQRRL